MHARFFSIAMTAALAIPCAISSATDASATRGSATPAPALDTLPLVFEPNVGQARDSAHFVARARGYTVLLEDGAASIVLDSEGAEPRLVTMRWNGAAASVAAEDELAGRVNYIAGDDPARWRTDVPTYARVRYVGVAPGVDLVFYGNDRNLEYDFVVAPGADPSVAVMTFDGARAMHVDDGGDLVMQAGAGELRQLRPIAFQRDGSGKTAEVGARYVVDGAGGVGIELGAFDARRELVIDPVLIYSTYHGGAAGDMAQGVAVDAMGFAYVVGSTSAMFPITAGAFDMTLNGGTDAFVSKISPAGNAVIYATYLGGMSDDIAYDVAVDQAGCAYVVGMTESMNFPSTPGVFDPTFNGASDAFVSKLNAMGNGLVYSTFLGNDPNERADSVAVDNFGCAFTTGTTESPGFPVTAGAFDLTYNGATDAFVTKLNPAGSALLYSTYLGGPGQNSGEGIAVDGAFGVAYVAGTTRGGGFPVTAGAFDFSPNGATDVFVTKLNPAGSVLLYSTFLGGNNRDYATDIAIGSEGGGMSSAYVTGYTRSPNFPTTAGAFDVTQNGGYDAFVTMVDAAGAALVYSTYLGGQQDDAGRGISVDVAGVAHTAGSTRSNGFPVTAGTIDATYNGGGDAFVASFDAAGAALVLSTFLGSPGADAGNAVAASAGDVWTAGYSNAAGFPVSAGAVQPAIAGGRDAFVVCIQP